MSTRLCLALAAALLLIRLPSLVQPMGADQGLYAYVGDRIRAGDLPYRNAWDQKPPAIHALYAGLRTLWPGDAVVPGADFVAAAIVAWLLYRIGLAIGPAGTGAAASLLFLLLSNPALTRLAGVRLRSQCETFIAVLLAAAWLILARQRKGGSTVAHLAAGVFLGLAFTFKYNTAVFVIAAVISLWLWKRVSMADVLRLAVGFSVPVVAMIVVFAIGGTLRPLIDATVFYNLQYSGETYHGLADVVRFLVMFPIERARADALWTVGGAGCILLLLGAVANRDRLVPVVWVGAACLSIAINGSRSLPQYFIQANPMLAIAAAWGGAMAWEWMRTALGQGAKWIAIPAAVIVAIGVWRVDQFPKLVEQTIFDARYALGAIPRSVYLARYDDDRKYSAADAEALGLYLKSHSRSSDRVYVFGFTCAAYLKAERASASRFFWSRPVIVGFNASKGGYGPEGLLSDLSINRPAAIALQLHDWSPDVSDSAAYFMSTPALAGWLRANYVQAAGPAGFDVWLRRDGQP